jgi:hypothetical protein
VAKHSLWSIVRRDGRLLMFSAAQFCLMFSATFLDWKTRHCAFCVSI